MIPSCSIVARDSLSHVDLTLTMTGRASLIFNGPPCLIHPLNSPHAANYIHAMLRFGTLDLLVTPWPGIAGMRKGVLPLLARFYVNGRIAIAYVPTILSPGDCAALFAHDPLLPMILTGQDIVANRNVYNRVMASQKVRS